MLEKIFHFEGNPIQFNIRKGVEGCCDVLRLLSDESSRQCFNLFGLDPKNMKLSFLSAMDEIKQHLAYMGNLIDSLRFTPECLTERTMNLLLLQDLCENLAIEQLNSSLRHLQQLSFCLAEQEFKLEDIATLFDESNATLRVALFGTELDCKASDILGVLSAIEEARIIPETNAENLEVLTAIYSHAKNQLAVAAIKD